MFPYISITVPSYSVMAFLGAFFTMIFFYCRSKAFGIEFDDFIKLFVACIVGCILGAKLLFLITMVPQLTINLQVWQIPFLYVSSGYVFYGGLFGTIACYKYINNRMGKYTWENARNFLAPALPLFHAFGRIGCFLAGCCYGVPLNSPIMLAGIELTRIPVQLMESGFEFFLFFFLLICSKRYKKQNLMEIYLVMYAIFRFIIEFFRGDIDRGYWIFLYTSQWISLGIVCYYIYHHIKNKMLKTKA